MRTHVNPANLCTTGSVAAAFLALVLAAEGRLGGALIAVGVAAVLDSIDGPIARRTTPGGPFGAHLDLLADHAAFAMAPAFVLHQATLGFVPVWGSAACLLFVLAGAWRLARFGVAEDDRFAFTGLPLPPAGLIAAAAGALELAPVVAFPLVLALSLTMVSAIPFPTFSAIGALVRPSGPARSVTARDRRFDRGRVGQQAGRARDDGQRYPEPHEDERIGAPALARE